jgi:hypothetical protein
MYQFSYLPLDQRIESARQPGSDSRRGYDPFIRDYSQLCAEYAPNMRQKGRYAHTSVLQRDSAYLVPAQGFRAIFKRFRMKETVLANGERPATQVMAQTGIVMRNGRVATLRGPEKLCAYAHIREA